jgi:hypothetical protein
MNSVRDKARSTIARIAARPRILLHADDGEIDGDRQDFEVAPEQERIAEVARLSMNTIRKALASPGASSGSVTVLNSRDGEAR